jgi:predicted ester cyclase
MTDARTLIERMFDIIDNHRYDEFTTVVTEDVVQTNPQARLHSAADWIEFSKGWEAAIPDGRHTVTTCLQAGDAAAVEGYYRGTHLGPLQTPQGAVPATGRTLELAFSAFGTLRGGRLAEVHVYFDSMSIMAQLGLLPEPATA